MQARISKLIAKAELNQRQLARLLYITPSAVSMKIAGRRPWRQDEIKGLLYLLSMRLNRTVTYEQAFGPAAKGRGRP